MRILLLAAAAALPIAAASAQTMPAPSVRLYPLPAYLGSPTTVTAATPDLAARGFAGRAQSVRVVGEWQACSQANYQGTCVTLAGNNRLLASGNILSLRPASEAATAVSTATAAGAAATVNLDTLDVDAGTEGQDVAFFARPALGGTQVSAGTNDRTAGDAFCKLAGYSGSTYAARARTQTSGLIDLGASTKVRAFALRDVLCRR